MWKAIQTLQRFVCLGDLLCVPCPHQQRATCWHFSCSCSCVSVSTMAQLPCVASPILMKSCCKKAMPTGKKPWPLTWSCVTYRAWPASASCCIHFPKREESRGRQPLVAHPGGSDRADRLVAYHGAASTGASLNLSWALQTCFAQAGQGVKWHVFVFLFLRSK